MKKQLIIGSSIIFILSVSILSIIAITHIPEITSKVQQLKPITWNDLNEFQVTGTVFYYDSKYVFVKDRWKKPGIKLNTGYLDNYKVSFITQLRSSRACLLIKPNSYSIDPTESNTLFICAPGSASDIEIWKGPEEYERAWDNLVIGDWYNIEVIYSEPSTTLKYKKLGETEYNQITVNDTEPVKGNEFMMFFYAIRDVPTYAYMYNFTITSN